MVQFASYVTRVLFFLVLMALVCAVTRDIFLFTMVNINDPFTVENCFGACDRTFPR